MGISHPCPAQVCDDSCEWAFDGVCDDGTAPAYEDDWGTFESGRRWDDDWGGYLYDDVYYGGFYRGSKRVRNSQLQRLLFRPFSARFG